MTIEEIKELVELVLESGVAELEVARGDQRVRIRRNAKVTTHQVMAPVPAALHSPTSQDSAPRDPSQDDSVQYVKSPIVGTFYEAPAPDSPPFVRIGDRVQAGQVLCIIESMKLMNEIEAEMAGTISKQLVENGRPVEYGEALFALRAD